MGNINMTFNEWRNRLRADLEAAEQEKQAAALKAKDPQDHGELGVPSYNTEAVRSNMNLPKNPTENTVQDKDGTHGLCTVTKPNAVGEGEYPTAIDGDARDAAFKTPSTPLSKIANEEQKDSEQLNDDLSAKQAANKDSFELPADMKNDVSVIQKLAFVGNLVLGDERGQRLVAETLTKEAGRIEALNILNSVYEDIQKEAAAQINKQSAVGSPGMPVGDFDINGLSTPKASSYNQAPAQLQQTADEGVLDKILNGAKNIYNQGADALSGLKDNIMMHLNGTTNIPGIGEVSNKYLAAALGLAGTAGAGALAYNAMSDDDDDKAQEGLEVSASVKNYEEMCKSAHSAWLNAFETDFEKAAYMQGATDAAAAAEAAQDPAAAEAMGGEIPADDSQLTDEEVMSVIQEMVESGELTPDQVNALLEQVASDQAPSYTAEQLAQMLAEDVLSGAMPQEVADQIATEILEGMQNGSIPSEGQAAPEADPMAQPTGADQAMEVQASVNRSLELLNNLG